MNTANLRAGRTGGKCAALYCHEKGGPCVRGNQPAAGAFQRASGISARRRTGAACNAGAFPAAFARGGDFRLDRSCGVRGGARGRAARRPEIWTGYDASGGLGHFAAAGFALCAGRGGLFLTCR